MTEKSLLRLITCGSVDDGKSTLLGRLLVETGSAFDDELALCGDDLSRLVDGLEAASDGRPWRWPLLPTRDGAVPEILAAMRGRGWAIGPKASPTSGGCWIARTSTPSSSPRLTTGTR